MYILCFLSLVCCYWESVKGTIVSAPIKLQCKHTMATSPPERDRDNYLKVPLLKLNLAGV